MATTTLRQAHEPTLILIVHGPNPPSDAEWSSYLDRLHEALRELDNKITRLRGLVVTAGGGPSATQRRDMINVFAQRPCATAIMSGDMFTRSIVTAVSWFNPSIRAFTPDHLTAAEQYLGLSAATRMSARAELRRLAELVPRAQELAKRVLES